MIDSARAERFLPRPSLNFHRRRRCQTQRQTSHRLEQAGCLDRILVREQNFRLG